MIYAFVHICICMRVCVCVCVGINNNNNIMDLECVDRVLSGITKKRERERKRIHKKQVSVVDPFHLFTHTCKI
jgi:hypothetical protein